MYEIKIDKLDHFGRGIGKLNDKIIFIENALPNEIVLVKAKKETKKYYEGEILSYKEKNQDRVEFKCPYYNICGGCNIGHINYQNQLKFKTEKVENILEKYANIKQKLTIVPSEDQFKYRNKVTLHVKNNKIGYYQKNTNSLVEIEECLLLTDQMNKIIKLLKKTDLSLITEIVIRQTSKESMVVISGKVKEQETINILKPIVNTIVIFDKEYRTIYGNGCIYENINDLEYIISPSSFFQVNTKQMINLYNFILKNSKSNNKSIIDLYCGVGSIGIYLSKYAKSVLGIEINKYAIKDANKNKQINNLKNINFICEDVSKEINITYKPDIIIVDPPRKGLDNRTIEVLKQIKTETLIYVSCDPITLARDLKELTNTYKVGDIQLFDMFPNTYHVEIVCVLNHH